MTEESEKENQKSETEDIFSAFTPSPSSSKIKKRTQQDNNDVLYKKAAKVLTSEEDDFDKFGAFVASELRSLRNTSLVKLLKKKIQLAIIEVSDMSENVEIQTSDSTITWSQSAVVYSQPSTPLAKSQIQNLEVNTENLDQTDFQEEVTIINF